MLFIVLFTDQFIICRVTKFQRDCSHLLWTRYKYTEKNTFHDKLLKFYRSLGILIKITSGNILITPVLGRSLGNTVAVNITWTPNSEIARIEIRKSLYV